jgi:hypothetical protein
MHCVRGVIANAAPTIALQDRALLFHSWASCPGLIVSTFVGPESISLTCAECGREVGRLEPGMLDEFLALLILAAVS